jgi:hypothetical protein
MARGHVYTCATCGTSYEFCPKCAIVKPSYDAERYCSKEHAHIFEILSKHGCGLANAEETLAALASHNTIGLTESIAKHIASLKGEAIKEVE